MCFIVGVCHPPAPPGSSPGSATSKGDSFCYCQFTSYSFIVNDIGRTGRDLSLRIYNHEKGRSLSVQTIETGSYENDHSPWVGVGALV